MRRLPLALICALAACGDREEAASNDMTAEQALAARGACVGELLARTAQEDLQTLEASGTPEAIMMFSRALLQHAQLRYAVLAQTDSALNHSETTQDSIRHMQAADQFEIVLPAPGTVEANVITDYERRANAILADADHPCNWQHELND